MASSSVPKDASNVSLLQVHMNEYQALFTRSTYFITLSSSVWPLVILYLTLVVLVWNLLPQSDWRSPVLTWTSGIVVQVMLFVWVSLAGIVHDNALHRKVSTTPRPGVSAGCRVLALRTSPNIETT